jgi:peroxiredoxin
MQTSLLSRRRLIGNSALGGLVLGSGLAGGLLTAPALAAAPAVGAMAPLFSVTDIAGKAVSLADLKGKTVVLEWTNHLCPFVIKHYGSANMQTLQKDLTAKGIVWISIVSSAPGEQGHVDATQAAAIGVETGAGFSHKLLDPSGTLGRLYDARTTPHMFIISTDGVLRYNGAIDSIKSSKADDIAKAEPLFRLAADAVLAGRPVQNAVNPPYGCNVKYGKTTA